MHLRTIYCPTPICHYSFICYCMTNCLHIQLSASTMPSPSFFFMSHFTCLFELSPISANCEKALLDLARIYLGTSDLSSGTLGVYLLICRAKSCFQFHLYTGKDHILTRGLTDEVYLIFSLSRNGEVSAETLQGSDQTTA